MAETIADFPQLFGPQMTVSPSAGAKFGKWNGPGGKVEEGETYKETAIRECWEETGITPKDPEHIGDVIFYFDDKPEFREHTHIFIAREWEGEPHETEEMKVFNLFVQELAVDLGTANTLIIQDSRNINHYAKTFSDGE